MQTHPKSLIHWKLMIALVLGLSLVSQASAQAPLRWKFKEGDDLNYIMQRDMEGKITLSGAEIEFKLSMILDTTWKVKTVAKDGTGSIEETIDRVQMKLSSPLIGEMEFDSKKPDSTAGPIQPFIDAMIGQVFTMKISPLGKVSDIALPEKLTAAFGEAPGGRGQSIGLGIGGNIFSETGVKQMLEQSVLALPEGAATKGVTWKRKFDDVIKDVGTQATETTFKVEGPEKLDGKDATKITAVTELTFEPAADPKGECEITKQEGASTFYFDAATGRLIKGEGKQTAVMEISGPQDFSQDIKSTTIMKFGKSPEEAPAEEKKEEKK